MPRKHPSTKSLRDVDNGRTPDRDAHHDSESRFLNPVEAIKDAIESISRVTRKKANGGQTEIWLFVAVLFLFSTTVIVSLALILR